MPKVGFNPDCDCCGISKAQMSDDVLSLGYSLYQKEIHSCLGIKLGNLTLCSWCLAGITEELQYPVKESFGNVLVALEEFRNTVDEAAKKLDSEIGKANG